MPHQRAAARAERQALDVIVLLRIRRHAVDLVVHGRQRRADRQAADRLRRRQIALHQRRRDPQHARDVVEAVAGIVGRQQVGDVHVERQQIADGVLILGRDSAGGTSRCAPDSGWAAAARSSSAFEPRDERVVRRFIGARPPGRRHDAGAQLADDLLPHRCVRTDVGRDRACRSARFAGLQAFVVAGDAVALEERLSGVGRRLPAAAPLIVGTFRGLALVERGCARGCKRHRAGEADADPQRDTQRTRRCLIRASSATQRCPPRPPDATA